MWYGRYIVAWSLAGAIVQVGPKVICCLRRVESANGDCSCSMFGADGCEPSSVKDTIGVMFCVGACQLPQGEDCLV